MQLFYTPEISGDKYVFSKEESGHCIRVLRKQLGDTIHLVDGKGNLFSTELIDNNPKACQVKIISVKKEFGKTDSYIHLAVAPTKNNDRFEWFLEKATELGIHEITPIICERSERKIIKLERMNKILISAMKQSLKGYLPKLNNPIKFEDFINQQNNGDRFIAHCEPIQKSALKDKIKKLQDTLVMIGPEGDFSKKEISQAEGKGIISVELGKARLRTETAAIVSCHLINLKNQ
jgi:16S rRNA (uracil1498-N3)-methyltransferase